jgi:hypothetical protein
VEEPLNSSSNNNHSVRQMCGLMALVSSIWITWKQERNPV